MAKGARSIEWKDPMLDRLAEPAGDGGSRPALARAASQMHRLIHFNDPPVGYIGRLQTIRSISKLAIGDAGFTRICRPLAAWLPYIDAVLSAPDKFADDLKLGAPQRSLFLAATGEDPLRGLALTKHPLAGLLWPASEPSEGNRYLLLQGHMLAAQVSILKVKFSVARTTTTEVPDEGVYKYSYRPCLLARRFSRSNWVNALTGLPGDNPPDPDVANPIDPQAYQEALDSLIEESRKVKDSTFLGIEKEKLREALGSISAFIGRGIDGKQYLRRNVQHNTHKTRTPVNVTTVAVNADGQPDTKVPAAEIVTRTRSSSEERDELDKAGECPEDHLPRRHFILSSAGPRAAEHVRAAYDRANQLLPNRFAEPHPSDFERLVGAMRSAQNGFASLRDRLELIAWTEALFWLSCSPAQATGLMVGWPQTPLPDTYDFLLRLDESQNQDAAVKTAYIPRICIRAIEPPYRSEHVPIPGERERETFFEVADLGGLANSIRKLLEELRSSGRRLDLRKLGEQAVKIFSKSEETYLKELEGFFESIGLKSTFNAINPSELGKIIFQRAKEAGDIVSADLITCKDHELAKVRRWYFTPTVEHLRSVHERAVSGVMADLGVAAWEEKLAACRLSKEEWCVGSRRCVESDFLKKSVDTLRNIVKETVAVRTPEDRRQAFALKHNALTVLAVWAIDVSIGKRGTSHLYLHSSQYDRATGFGSMTEKGKARAFQLCPGSLSISKKYDAYIDRLANYGLPRSTRARPCYFLGMVDLKLQPVAVTPLSMKEVLSSLFRFDANWARRWVKTLALEQGLPAIYTDQYCGHAFRGEERHHPYGSFDPVPYFRSMTGFAQKLLGEITLTPELFDPTSVEPCL